MPCSCTAIDPGARGSQVGIGSEQQFGGHGMRPGGGPSERHFSRRPNPAAASASSSGSASMMSNSGCRAVRGIVVSIQSANRRVRQCRPTRRIPASCERGDVERAIAIRRREVYAGRAPTRGTLYEHAGYLRKSPGRGHRLAKRAHPGRRGGGAPSRSRRRGGGSDPPPSVGPGRSYPAAQPDWAYPGSSVSASAGVAMLPVPPPVRAGARCRRAHRRAIACTNLLHPPRRRLGGEQMTRIASITKHLIAMAAAGSMAALIALPTALAQVVMYGGLGGHNVSSGPRLRPTMARWSSSARPTEPRR